MTEEEKYKVLADGFSKLVAELKPDTLTIGFTLGALLGIHGSNYPSDEREAVLKRCLGLAQAVSNQIDRECVQH